MNVGDFLVFGTASLWFLGGALVFSTIVSMKNSKDLLSEMKKGREATSKLESELGQIRTDLREDTSQLKKSTNALDTELQMLRKIIASFQKTLQYQFSYWFPLAGGHME